MIKLVRFSLIVLFSLTMLSWSSLGHRTIGLIADRHLSPKAKYAVQSLLPGSSLAEVSTWVDEVRGEAQYKSTGPWHYINLPSGLDRKAFEAAVKGMNGANVYEALNRMQQPLRDPMATTEEKVIALKWLCRLRQTSATWK
ncbi:S1/P1 nuclease [Paraflavisolibacter sp. H34]|uniref:S1/P1 nuclease n=1 Tax=Huijunlia imazamoxiresistens TaxID=3127457 RepID=UPI003019A151